MIDLIKHVCAENILQVFGEIGIFNKISHMSESIKRSLDLNLIKLSVCVVVVISYVIRKGIFNFLYYFPQPLDSLNLEKFEVG